MVTRRGSTKKQKHVWLLLVGVHVQCMCSACAVHVQCMCSACAVHAASDTLIRKLMQQFLF